MKFIFAVMTFFMITSVSATADETSVARYMCSLPTGSPLRVLNSCVNSTAGPL